MEVCVTMFFLHLCAQDLDSNLGVLLGSILGLCFDFNLVQSNVFFSLLSFHRHGRGLFPT